jgi:hypothetical protein
MAFAHESPDPTVKKSVTLRRSLAEQIEERTGPRGFSSFIDQAAEHALALLKAQEIIDDYEAEHGPISDEALERARRAWHSE